MDLFYHSERAAYANGKLLLAVFLLLSCCFFSTSTLLAQTDGTCATLPPPGQLARNIPQHLLGLTNESGCFGMSDGKGKLDKLFSSPTSPPTPPWGSRLGVDIILNNNRRYYGPNRYTQYDLKQGAFNLEWGVPKAKLDNYNDRILGNVNAGGKVTLRIPMKSETNTSGDFFSGPRSSARWT